MSRLPLALGRFAGVILIAHLTGCARDQEVTSLIRVRRKSDITTEHVVDSEAEYDSFKATQATLVKSVYVVNAAIRKPDVRDLPMLSASDDPATWLSTNLRVQLDAKSELVRVSLRGNDQQQLAKTVDAVVQAYLDEIVASERESEFERLDILKRSYRRTVSSIKKEQETISTLHKELGSTSLATVPTRRALLVRQLDRLERRLDRLETKLEVFEIEIDVVSENPPPETGGEENSNAGEHGQTIIRRLLDTARQEYVEQTAKLVAFDGVSAELDTRIMELEKLTQNLKAEKAEMDQLET